MVEQPARAASRGRVSGANMPTVLHNDARPVQGSGGRLIRIPQPPSTPGSPRTKKTQDFIVFLTIKKNKTISMKVDT